MKMNLLRGRWLKQRTKADQSTRSTINRLLQGAVLFRSQALVG
jgi:hypothetical protein